jgi:AraC-like DNA-binding protein
MDNSIEYKIIKPDPSLADYVERFWMLTNRSKNEKEIVAIPDGRIDIFFTYSDTKPFHIALLGLESKPTTTPFPASTVMFGISLKLLAVEYLLDKSISNLLNSFQLLPVNFWDINKEDLSDLNTFSAKASTKMQTLIKEKVDARKKNLFDLIYSSNGSLSVKALSEKVNWSSRQINRYFNQQFGITLKTYCNILRFRASFEHIKEGNLSPQQNFADQAHFIKEVKKLSGVIPKELHKNKDDRFIQLSTLP